MTGPHPKLPDGLPDAALTLRSGRIAAYNDLAGRELGLGDDSVGREPAEALGLAPQDAARLADALKSAAAEGDVSRLELDVGGRPRALAVRTRGDEAVVTVRPSTSSSELIARLSHDIRSPLTSVKGFVRTLLSRWDAFADDHRRALLETIEVDADRVARLLTRLLEVARLDAGRTRVHPTPLDVLPLVESVVGRVAGRFDGGRDRVTVSSDGDVPSVLGDSDKLELALDELLDNALRYSGGAAVHVRVRTGSPGEAVVELRDEGPGVEEAMRERLFDRFCHGEDRRAGTGLGLYLARGMIRAQGGDVRVDDDGGPGCTVTMHVPTVAGAGASGPGPPSVQSQAGTRDGGASTR